MAVQPGVEKVVCRPHDNLPVSEGTYRKGGEGLFDMNYSDRARNNVSKLKDSKLRLDVWKKIFTECGGTSCPGKLWIAPIVEEFKDRLAKALLSLVQWEYSCHGRGGWD